jgi:hypothetical protein
MGIIWIGEDSLHSRSIPLHLLARREIGSRGQPKPIEEILTDQADEIDLTIDDRRETRIR